MARTTKTAAAAAAPAVAGINVADMAATIAALQAQLAALQGATAAPTKVTAPADGGAVWPGDGNAWNVILPKGAKVVFKTFADAKDKTGVEHVVTLDKDSPVTITGYVSGVHWGKVAPKVMRKAKA